MSTYWHIRCVDCKNTHTFDCANHEEKLMLMLCRNAESIAALDDMMRDPESCDVKLRTNYGEVDTAWFRSHLGHQLLPIDEYGHVLGQCLERVVCECGASHACDLSLNHEGPHEKAKK